MFELLYAHGVLVILLVLWLACAIIPSEPTSAPTTTTELPPVPTAPAAMDETSPRHL